MSDDDQRTHGQGETDEQREPVKITPDGATSRPERRVRSNHPPNEQAQQAAAEAREGDEEEVGRESKKPTRKVSLPSQAGLDQRMAYATHRPAPGEEEAEQEPRPPQTVETEAPAESDTEVSASFVLGVVVIVIAVILGIILARMNARLGRLEQRVEQMENAPELPGE